MSINQAITDHEEEVLLRVMEPFPEGVPIVPFSTPVISFGQPHGVKVATLGINPSSGEFLDSKMALLTDEKKRLIDRADLGRPNAVRLTRDEAIKVVDGCYQYFSDQGNPYKWFKFLESFAVKPAGASYWDGSACHLDLVQWATNPVWSGISNVSVREDLLNKDMEFLRYQLTQYKFPWLLLNGREVIAQFEKLKIGQLKKYEWDTVRDGDSPCEFVTGRYEETKVLGWSRNIPHYGTSNLKREAIANWVAKQTENFDDHKSKIEMR